MSAQDPFVFLVGCWRSGTSLLQRIVDAHSEIAITRAETHWIPKYFKARIGITDDGRVTGELLAALLVDRRFREFESELEREEIEQLIPRDGEVAYADFVRALFDVYARKRGKSLAGDKTPGYVREISLLHQLFPGTRFVHLIRDGRDICLSALNWEKRTPFAEIFPTWTEDPVTTAALLWRINVLNGLTRGAPLGPDLYYELRYESLVHQPEAACGELCAFLGLPYEEAMLRFYEGRGRTRLEPGQPTKRAWLPITPGLRDWRTQMPADDVERFEAAAGDLLERLEYGRRVPRPGPKRLAHAARIRERFVAALPGRYQPLPEGW